MNKRLILLLLLSFSITTAIAAPVPGATNKDGSIVTGVLTASFDPLGSFSGRPVLPFPTSLMYGGTTDLTVNIPVTDPDNFQDPAVAINSLDGFSTTEKWITEFANNDDGAYENSVPGSIDPASVVPGQSVRVFQVTTQEFVAVTSIVRELTPGVDYVAVAATDSIVAIIPLQPLPEYSDFMAVLTNDIKDTDGNDATPDRFYNFAKQQTPWIDENGNSTSPLFDDATAAGLEGFRQIVQSMELNAASVGINPADIILSWTVHTQSITPTLKLLRSIAQPAPTQIVPTGIDTSILGGPGLADIYIGVITLPYYLGVPSAENPIAPLTDFWKAAPGAYVPPFDQFGLDPTSTNITIANPFPVLTDMQTVPLLITVPNAKSGFSKPAGGWPVVIYMHGITRQRTDMLLIADTVASVGYALIAMDQPLHGVVPESVEPPAFALFYIENTPFAPIANERTFDADYWDNVTGAPGPDGITDPSGRSAFNLANLQATRDNFRQGEADWSTLTLSVQNMSIDGDALPDFNMFDVTAVSHSGGGFLAIPWATVEPIVSRLYINATAGGMMRTFNGGHFGPDFVQPFLSAFAGIEPGTPEFEQYLLAAQTVLDSADSINWAAEAAMKMPIIHNQVMEDGTVPNVIPGAPLAGSEALNRIMGLNGYSSTQADPEGLSGVARFVQPAGHESLFRPDFPAVTAEMQGQMASFIVSGGTFVNVGNPDLLVPVVQVEPRLAKDLTVKNGEKAGDGKKRIKRPNRFKE
jgi:hypothetical protein